MVAERVFSFLQRLYQDFCVRPATVCGLSPRMRLDVSVNMLTYQALKNKKITVFGGDQTRPNIHILDMVNIYKHFLMNDSIESGCYNAGFENISIFDIAKKVQKQVDSEIIITPSNDPRSYRQDSNKLTLTGFKKSYGIDFAIKEIIDAYKNNQLLDDETCYTVKWMKHLSLEK